MIDFTFTPEIEAVRLKVRAFMDEQVRPQWDAIDQDDRAQVVKAIVKLRKLAREDWNLWLPHMPAEWGGMGLGPTAMAAVSAEAAKVSIGPFVLNAQAPDEGNQHTLLHWATPEQKEKYLRPLCEGTARSCFAMTEPEVAGSDPTLIKTFAYQDGDEWVINGQKVWTTGGHHADYCFLLTRTDPSAAKHAGITYLLVPMRQPGVEVRGIVQPDGTAEFCEVFFTDARCSKNNVVGGVNNGWKVANSTLAFERGMSATTGYRRFEEEFRLMTVAAKENGSINDDTIRQRLMQFYSKIQILRYNGLRSLSATLENKKDMGVLALGASNKMDWSEMHQRAMELALDINGANSMLINAGPADGNWPGALRDKRREGYPVSSMMSTFFFSRSETIWGGTSQIQRNIVGERVLGLPKEPKPQGDKE
jgi:alkylation response protein AidB-like acyl-CoA dehydrogenase